MKATLKRVLLPLICSAFVVVLDQITKNIVSGYGVSLNDTYIIPHLLQYNYLHNTGAGMGTLSGGGWFLIPVTAIAIVLGIVAIFSKWGKESLL
ncbi:MAG: signal peptidase II, partial [Clostridia bacterium]|nr:signal peptidase II [Clostridia bacterium]